ncbi:Hypothetical predicted protein [Mytilus galloprovincialis]|uniref:Apple domain-containing protein n=1 Tax=Mytilus galloprovincialis TaxID=29158 RepID=A0A8B6BNT3_MYTGA|nr:Hypothetical predicted protein [Mytilus galloprovincialis]
MHPYLFGKLFLSSFVQFSTSQCYNGTFSCIINPTEPGRRFPGTVFMTFEKFGPNQCFDECIRRARCESFNYKASEFYCELNTGHGIESNTSNDFVNDAKYEYTSMEGLRKTFYDPCIYTSGCYPGTVCSRQGDGTRSCEIEDVNVYQNHLESIATTTPEVQTTEVQTTEVTTPKMIESNAAPENTTEVNKNENAATTMEVNQNENAPTTMYGSNLTEVTTVAAPRPKK